MTAVSRGPIHWSMQRDESGHRDYLIDFRVETNSTLDGPATVTWASGLPVVGAFWDWGNDVDLWAFCWPTMSVTPQYDEESSVWWKVSMKYSTRPFRHCRDTTIEDPLLEPPKINGGFVTRTEDVTRDRNDELIMTSSHELVQVSKDKGGPTVNIEMNVASLDLEQFAEAMHKLNDASLWGLDERHWKLNNGTWTRNFYGSCNVYYTVSYEFEARFEGWDEGDIVDAGTRCLRGKWVSAGTAAGSPQTWEQDADADPDDPDDYVVVKDSRDENYGGKILLDGSGGRLTSAPENYHLIPNSPIEIYDEYNFLSLGIPSSLV